VDVFGALFRYLVDGRRKTIDPATGEPPMGRVLKRGPVIWSLGRDTTQDPRNDNLDNDGNGKVDDPGELADDIGSWHWH